MADAPNVEWIPSDQNRWNVPVLDIRPVTQGMTSLSSDPTCARNAVSWQGDDGASFADARPESTRSVPSALRYKRDAFFADGVLFTPSVMEHKWALFHHAGAILCVRSWTRRLHVSATVEQDGDEVRLTQIRGVFLEETEDPALTAGLLDVLLRTHALGLVHPVPLWGGLEKTPQDAALACFSLFGSMAQCATHHPLAPTVPETPLRGSSMLHIAVARGDGDAVRAWLARGLPVELRSADGLTPMHWALARPDAAMLELLLEQGAPVDSRSIEGATPLMSEVQGSAAAHAEWLLDHGADPNARDDRGFTALHRAAEMGKETLAALLLRRGADPGVEAAGHTPRSLALQRGHEAIARMLKR